MTERVAFTLKQRRDGEVLYVSFVGLYTAEAHLAAKRLIARELQAQPAKAVVFNLLGAVHLMGDAERASVRGAWIASASELRVPLAFVVPRHMFQAITSHCAEMWAHGFLWVAFVDPSDALDWAARRRGVSTPRASLHC